MRRIELPISVPLLFASMAVNAAIGPVWAADAHLELDAIVKEGTPGDVLMQDPIVPAQKGKVTKDATSGSIQKSLSDDIPLVVSGTGEPGGASQFRGLGRSSEDTDVQTLGIPLNPPQGGGFDLSVFPQFIWAGYEFQAGPALGTFDPRGTAGSLTLIPWSARALMTGEGPAVKSGRASLMASSLRLLQVSAAGSDGQHLAAVAGYSSGDAVGPSLAFSSRWKALSFHLLATDIDAKSPGPENMTPLAHQRTARVIPLAQLDLPVGDQGLLKSSAYFDWSSLKYEDPSVSALPMTQDRVAQLGTENALLWGSWKFGAGLRGVRYEKLGRDQLGEALANLIVSRVFEPGSYVVEPVLRAVGVSRYGVLPEASLGVRREQGELAWFARGGLSRRFPSLVNRYYSYPGFVGYPGYVGNPAVAPERDWTVNLGSEWKARTFEASMQVFGQMAEDAQMRAPLDAQTDTLVNAGTARILSLMPSITWMPSGWVDLHFGATLSASKVSETGLAYAGLPGFLGVSWVSVHEPARRKWEGRAILRSSSASVADTVGNRLPAYQEVNLEALARVWDGWSVTARMENVLNARVELVRGYPSVGRSFALLTTAQW